MQAPKRPAHESGLTREEARKIEEEENKRFGGPSSGCDDITGGAEMPAVDDAFSTGLDHEDVDDGRNRDIDD